MVDFHTFMISIGIKKSYIKKFINSDNFNKNNDNLTLFYNYLDYLNLDSNDDINTYLEEVEYLKNKVGFRHKYSQLYINSLKGVYNYDTSINWIVRIVESFFSMGKIEEFCNFYSKCNKII